MKRQNLKYRKGLNVDVEILNIDNNNKIEAAIISSSRLTVALR